MENTAKILAIKEGDQKVIHELYNAFQPKFVNWLKGRYKIKQIETCHEIYQRSFTVLYFNIKKDKLNDLQASIETYLFGIGKMVLKEWWREEKKQMDELDENMAPIEEVDIFGNLFDSTDDKNLLTHQIAAAMEKLDEPCKSVIRLFYWERNSMEAIASKLNYKNEQVAKKKKYLCIKKLKELLKQ